MRIRTVHKWVGIVVGLVLLMWTVTGIIMVLPGNRIRDDQLRHIDLARATIPPSALLTVLEGRDSLPALRSVALVPILDRVIYQIETRRRTILIDASSGDRFQITPEVARQIAIEKFGGTPGSVQVEHLTAYDARYPGGALPVFRVTLGDSASTVAYVSERDGSVVTGDSRRRFRSAAGRLHDFSVIKLLVSADWVHRTLAIGACLVAMASILTGYWLALPLPRTPRPPRARVTEPMSRREK